MNKIFNKMPLTLKIQKRKKIYLKLCMKILVKKMNLMTAKMINKAHKIRKNNKKKIKIKNYTKKLKLVEVCKRIHIHQKLLLVHAKIALIKVLIF